MLLEAMMFTQANGSGDFFIGGRPPSGRKFSLGFEEWKWFHLPRKRWYFEKPPKQWWHVEVPCKLFGMNVCLQGNFLAYKYDKYGCEFLVVNTTRHLKQAAKGSFKAMVGSDETSVKKGMLGQSFRGLQHG